MGYTFEHHHYHRLMNTGVMCTLALFKVLKDDILQCPPISISGWIVAHWMPN